MCGSEMDYGALELDERPDAPATRERHTGHRRIVTRTRIGGAIVAVTLAAMGAVVSVPRKQYVILLAPVRVPCDYGN